MAFKRTKIVCTIGPATASPEMLRSMIQAGMNVARLNFSHGTHEEHAQFVKRIRAASEALGEPVAILQDLQGPKIRVGALPEAGITLEKGSKISFVTEAAPFDGMRLPVSYDRLHEDVKPGERILLDDGLLSARVVEVDGLEVRCEVVDGGLLKSHKGVNFPDSRLSVSPLTEKDRADLIFGVGQEVDFIALSFVRSARELNELRSLIEAAELAKGVSGRAPIRIVAKVEKREAVERMGEIIDASDAIMVARGDLGVETAAEQVPIVQKRLVSACAAAGKPVIVATQMLDSMIRHPRPTRAEVSDVANAVIDHADAVMLSGETANGAYPLEAVTTMATIIRAVETSSLDDIGPDRTGTLDGDPLASANAEAMAGHSRLKAVSMALPFEGLVQAVGRLRPQLPIVVMAGSARTQRQLALSWGLLPVLFEQDANEESWFERTAATLKQSGLAASADAVAFVSADPLESMRYHVTLRSLP